MNRLRNTRQRQLVLDAVRARSDHPSADQIYQDVREADGKISRGTVYRNLNILVKQGDILQVKLPHAVRYEARPEKHYHLLCKGCGAVCDLPLEYRLELDGEAAEKTGFAVERHRTIFEGLCPDCQSKKG